MTTTTVRRGALAIEAAAFSDTGPRPENQDVVRWWETPDGWAVAVADGMGGQRSGRLAAEVAVDALAQAGPLRSLDDLRRVVRAADAAVRQRAQEGHEGMGCALGLLVFAAPPGDVPRWLGAHVGDVRILSRAPDGTLRLETRDHTPAFARWEAGELAFDAIPDAPGANRLQRAVGHGGEPDVFWLPARPGWRFALLSDGVTKALRWDELAVALAGPPTAALDALRRKLTERGTDDNATAVVLEVHPAAPEPTPNPEDTVPHPPPWAPAPRRGAALPLMAALLALLVALAAAALAWQSGRREAALRREIEALRLRVDSLRDRLSRVEEPFGPSPGTPPAP